MTILSLFNQCLSNPFLISPYSEICADIVLPDMMEGYDEGPFFCLSIYLVPTLYRLLSQPT